MLNEKTWIDSLREKKLEKELEDKRLGDKKRKELAEELAQLYDRKRSKVFCPMVRGNCVISCECYSKAYVGLYVGYADSFLRAYEGCCTSYTLKGEV